MNPNDHSLPLPTGPGDSGGPPPSPELEARLVAWVAGEASAFEIAELERLVREQPALADLKHRLEEVHALTTEAAQPDREPLRLSDERRDKLLATLRGTTSESSASAADKPGVAAEKNPAASSVVAPFSATKQKQHRERGWILGLASCAAVGLFAGILFLDRSQQSDRAYKAAALNEESTREKHDRDEKRAAETTARVRAEAMKQREDQAFREPQTVHFSLPEGPAFRPTTVDFAPALDVPAEAEAKTAVKDEGQGIVALTPFAVSAEQDRGYQASNTLAGTRLNTAVRDHANPAITPEFLKDLAATNQEALLAHTTNTEVGGAQSGGRTDATWSAGNDGILFGAGAQGGITTGGKADPAATPADDVVRLSAFTVAVNEKRADADAKPVVSVDAFSDTKSEHTEGSARQLAAASGDKGRAATGGEASSDQEAQARFRRADQNQPARPAVAAKAAPKNVAARHGQSPAPAGAPVAPPPAKLAKEKAGEDLPLVRIPPPAQPLVDELVAAQEPFSTFSLHVSDVSFRLAQKSLASGQLPDPASIRAEEFYNAFDYADASPSAAEKVGCRIEQSAHPSLQQRNLVRIAVKVPSTGRGAGTPLRLTVLLDTSGSMEREDRAATVRAALGSLVSLLGANDRLTVIGFSRQPRLVLDGVAGDRAAAAIAQLGALPSDGGTNLEEALKLGRELAQRHFDAAAQNRLVVLTDGAANLGNADPAALAAAVEQLRGEKIAFDACGVGLDGLDDTMLEALTRRGDGRYYVLASPAAADAGFAKQLAGAFRPAAANVKLQVRFNPARVGRYRLLGFEKHRLRTEDFRNDAVDAAELAADEAAVAVYQVEALPQGEGELGDVFVRFRDTASGEMVERSWTMLHNARAAAFDRAAPNVQLAGAAALFAELLRDRPADLDERLAELAPVVNALRAKFPHEPRVAEFTAMFEQARRLARR